MHARPILAIALGLSLLGAIAGCNDKLTSENYAKIENGMSLSQVQKFLGKGERLEVGGMSISGAGVAGGSAQSSQTSYNWRKGNKEIVVTFENGKVVSHNAKGL